MQCALTRARKKEKTGDLDEVTNVQQFECSIRLFPDIVNTEVNLYTAGAIFNFEKGHLAHFAHEPNAARKGKRTLWPLPLVKVF